MAIPFDYSSEYKRKLCTPDEAARVIKSGDWIDVSMGGAFPSLMDAAISRYPRTFRDTGGRGLPFSRHDRIPQDAGNCKRFFHLFSPKNNSSRGTGAAPNYSSAPVPPATASAHSHWLWALQTVKKPARLQVSEGRIPSIGKGNHA